MLADLGDSFLRGLLFEGRGLSRRTIRALVDCEIDAPERLLFMSENDLKKIPLIGKASMAEIRTYRDRFVPNR
jgi:DNA-directed RNA polymerase alpha subunit